MEHKNISQDAMRPVIHMIDHESDTIEAFAMALEARNPKVAELLYEELGSRLDRDGIGRDYCMARPKRC